MKPINIPTEVTNSTNRIRVLVVTPSEIPKGYVVKVEAPGGKQIAIPAGRVALVEMSNPHSIYVLVHDEFSRWYQEVQVME